MKRNGISSGCAAASLVGVLLLSACGNGGRQASLPPEPVSSAAATPAGQRPSEPPYNGRVAFSAVAEGLTAAFTDQSRGEVDSRAWDFGDGATSTAATPIHVYSREGLYAVTEKVVDAGGNASSRTRPVRVMPFPPELHNGAVRANLSAVATYELAFYARPLLGANRLDVEMSGANGEADLYVKFGSVPTDDSFDCHAPVQAGVAKCVFDAPHAGPYYARVLARKNFADASLKATWDEVVADAQDKKSGALSAAENH